MNWKHYKLGELIEIKHGYAFSGEFIQEEDNGIVLVTPGNFSICGGFQEKKCKFFSGELPKNYILKAGDFIVTMTDLSKTTDTLGYSALVPDNPNRTYLHNQRIGLVTIKSNECDRNYLYWLMRTHYYQRSIANTATGSTVHHTSPSKIYDFEFNAPDLPTQKRIASILSAYDDLIEVNRKQIKLLEEAAERLYREWFIDLHFPGHENTPIIDGLPQGWKIEKIGKSFDLYLGGTPARNNSNFWEGGTIPWINSGAVNQSRIIEGNELITELAVKKSATKLLPKHCTLVAITGATLGQVSFNEIETCANQSVVAIKDRTNVFDEYMLLFIKHNITSIINKANGSAQQHINKGILEDFEIIIPSDIVIKTYHARVKLLNDKICNLLLQNKNLAAARDLLLPRLMNGEINL